MIRRSKLKDIALNFKVYTYGADLYFVVRKPKSAVGIGGHPSYAFARPLLFTFPWFPSYPFGVGYILAKLTESFH